MLTSVVTAPQIRWFPPTLCAL